jgi:hypothetical protein
VYVCVCVCVCFVFFFFFPLLSIVPTSKHLGNKRLSSGNYRGLNLFSVSSQLFVSQYEGGDLPSVDRLVSMH